MGMAKRKITRLDAVRDQLHSAIRAYFLWDDLVSALTLAGAAERVLSDKQSADGLFGMDAFSIRSMVNLYIKDEYQPEAAKLFRADYDFFRHADRKPQNDYELSEEWVDFLLLISIGSFEFLCEQRTEIMTTFVWWFSMKYPHWLKKNEPFADQILRMKEITKYVSKKEYYMIAIERIHKATFWES
jgi:hypothetical protein